MWKQPWMMFILEMADMPRNRKKKDVPIFESINEIKQRFGTN